ncbi:MAG: hypothetical protein R3B70_48950 [Polyangiaceae bacterium]
MPYNFQDDPSPIMPAAVNSSGTVVLVAGSDQGDLITSAFSGSTVSISISPPRGWSLDTLTWVNGGNGTFSIPPLGTEDTHPFIFTVSKNGSSQTNTGQFKIKRQSGGA